MKKIISLQVLVAMGLVIGSASLIEAYGDSNKYANNDAKKSLKKTKSATRPVKESGACSDKATMKSIERELHNVRRDFDKSGDAAAANERLSCIPAQIKQVIASMKNNEVHGKIWETHEHTLNRKLKEARAHVKRNAKN